MKMKEKRREEYLGGDFNVHKKIDIYAPPKEQIKVYQPVDKRGNILDLKFLTAVGPYIVPTY